MSVCVCVSDCGLLLYVHVNFICFLRAHKSKKIVFYTLIRGIYVCAPFSTLGYSIFYSIFVPYTRAIFLYAFAARPFCVFVVVVFFQPFFLFLAKELHAENLFWFVRRNCLTKMQTTGQLIKNIEIFFNWIAIFVRPECTWQCCGDLFQVSIGLAHILRTSIAAAIESMCKQRDIHKHIHTRTQIRTRTHTHADRVHRTNALGLNFYFQFDSLLVFFFRAAFSVLFFCETDFINF